MAASDQRYMRHEARRIDNRHSVNIANHRQASALIGLGRQSTAANRLSQPLSQKGRQTVHRSQTRAQRTSRKLQLLNFEASHQSIFHSPLPLGLG